jgi:hypothetical protein
LALLDAGVEPVVLAFRVEAPVLLEVAVADDRAQGQDRLGCVQCPINPLLIQAVFNKALFVPGGPNLHLLYVLVAVMALVPVVSGAIGILQTYETTRVGQLVMRDLRTVPVDHPRP